MVALTLFAGALAGAIIGSFLATLILRWPRGERLPKSRSRCDQCLRTLAARDLVPILSTVVQRGRCRTCGGRIASLHWHVEITCASIGASALAIAPAATGIALALMGWLLVPLAWLDWRHQWLPDPLNLLLGAGGLAVGGFLGIPLFDRLVGMIVGFGALWSVGAAYRTWRGREGLGGGDPKMFGAVGAWIGWIPLAPVLALAAGMGLAVALARRMDRGGALPFGTMIAPAAWLAALTIVAKA